MTKPLDPKQIQRTVWQQNGNDYDSKEAAADAWLAEAISTHIAPSPADANRVTMRTALTVIFGRQRQALRAALQAYLDATAP